ncbi:MAG TPA: exodeoxyribonuclease VII large subunit, partial [Abditibacteriaceae bacterium]
ELSDESGDKSEVTGLPLIESDGVLSVGELAWQIARVLEADPILSDVVVRGEISNFKAYSSGHLYFTLKDGDAQIRCCCWKTYAGRLQFRPNNGDRVVALGRIEFYAGRGEVSFIVSNLRFDGQGALAEAFERLKNELAAEGLFDPERKKPLPHYPRRIGLITSPSGAVAHDVVTILRRRWPVATIVFIPSAVQGFSAVPDLMRALSWAGALDDLDAVIVARGGGSAEDLWCFNDEDLVRAASRCPVPLISAIGHETDFTLLDFVADLRAPTPSAAAELVAPDVGELQAALYQARRRLFQAVAGEVRLSRQRLEAARRRKALSDPGARLVQSRTQVAQLRVRVQDAARRRVKIERQALTGLRGQLRALDPQRTLDRALERGFALVRNESGELLTNAQAVQAGQRLVIQWRDGAVQVTVDE